MGGLFSSSSNESRSQTRYQQQQPSYHYESPRISYNWNDSVYHHRQYDEQQLRREMEREAQNEEAKRQEHKNNILHRFQTLNCHPVYVQDSLFNLRADVYFNKYIAVHYVTLSDIDSEYFTIKKLISNKKNFKIDRIDKVENPLLQKSYDLKKEQKIKQFPLIQERLMFHGTKSTIADKICKLNFDWRSVKEHKFGKGISFSSNSTYASVYSGKCYNKIMLVAKVLIGRSCPGNKFMEIPPSDEFDTSMKNTPQNPNECNDIVTVKYDDSEFYPAYKIHYHLIIDNPPRRSSNRR